VANAINMPSVTAEEAPRLKPYMSLCGLLGAMAGQLTAALPDAAAGAIRAIRIEYEGQAADLNHRPLTAAALAGVLTPLSGSVNMVNAPVLAKERGIEVAETTLERSGEYQTLVRLVIESERWTRSVSGTLVADAKPRLVAIKGIAVEADFAPHMLYVTNEDKPGFVGRFGSLLADSGVNIATFHMGRTAPGGEAICLVAVDGAVPDSLLDAVRRIPLVNQASRLSF
jgi:D-3-phosphoglycerate dehydrogenase